jgi:hypothetical protein
VLRALTSVRIASGPRPLAVVARIDEQVDPCVPILHVPLFLGDRG